MSGKIKDIEQHLEALISEEFKEVSPVSPLLHSEIDKLEFEKRKAEITSIKQDIGERKDYARHIFALIVMWLFFILLIIIGVGKGFLILSDTVLVTLITTTTINICGFFIIVIKYLFPQK